jgi:HlyD family secretion protein
MSLVCAIPLIASLFSVCADDGPPRAVGYVESEHVLLAPNATAQLLALNVRRGDAVTSGMVLARMEDADAKIAVEQAKASLAQAQAQLADLREGKRPEEIGVLEATLNSATAQAREAERVANRLLGLSKRGIASAADLDSANTNLETTRAMVGQANANLAVARLPARAQTIAAAEQQVKGAKASLDAAEWHLAQRTIISPAQGVVSDIIRNPGDIVGPQAPVLDILPDGAVKIRLYFPEKELAKIKPGTSLVIHCDGCPKGLEADVSYISDEPEFTPPVIYSLENRQKLVFLIEAQEKGGGNILKPGQIVDASIAGPTQ